jgi:hypothetical protein
VANPYAIFPDRPTFYQYLGSQTVPPCEENVFWNYLSEYVSIDDPQAATLTRFILEYIDSNTCTFGTVADMETFSTSRPAVDAGGRPVSLTGSCNSGR